MEDLKKQKIWICWTLSKGTKKPISAHGTPTSANVRKQGDFLLFTKQNDIEIGQLGVYLKGDRFFIKQKGNGILRSLNVNIPDEPLTADWECIGKFYEKAQLPQ